MTRHKRHVAVLSLIISLTVTGPLYAGTPQKIDASENCADRENGAGLSISWIFCVESQRNKAEFDNVFTETDNDNSDSDSDSGPVNRQPAEQAVQQPQATVKPPRGAKEVKDDAHRHGGGHFLANQKPHSKSTSRRARNGKGRGGNNKAKGRRGQQRHHPVLVGQKDRTPRKIRPRRVRPKPLTDAEIRALIHSGVPLWDLTKSERAELKRLYKMLLRKRTTKAVLAAIKKGEGGGLLTIVGGTRRKDWKCRQLIGALDTSGHPKEQGLPDRCFLTTRRHGLSTAAGLYQIVYYVNWRHLRRLLDLKDFSAESQSIAALELMRSSRTKDGNVGDGLVALLKNDWANAIRKGTDPWASSPYSRWRDKHAKPYLEYAREHYRNSVNES